MAPANYFPPPGWPDRRRSLLRPSRLCIAKQNSWPAAILRFAPALRVQNRLRPRQRIAVKAAISAADPPARKAPAMSRNEAPSSPSPTTTPITEPHAASPTAHLLDELALCGHRPGQDEPDPRPLPEPDAIQRPARRDGRSLQRHADRHAARRRSRRSAVVVRQSVPPQARPHRTRTRQQRTGAAPRPGRTGRLRGQVGRARAPDRAGPQPDRTPQRLRIRRATTPPNCSRSPPAPPGARAPDRSSITAP